MRTLVNTGAVVAPKSHAPADNTAAVITLAAASGIRHVVDKVFGGYDSYADSEKSLTIVVTVCGDEVTLSHPVLCESSSQGAPVPAFDLNFIPPIQGDENTAVVITLPAAGAGIAGKLNAITR